MKMRLENRIKNLEEKTNTMTAHIKKHLVRPPLQFKTYLMNILIIPNMTQKI